LVFVVALARRVVLGIWTLVGVLVCGNLSTFLGVICAIELRVFTLFLAPRFLRLRHAPSSRNLPSTPRYENRLSVPSVLSHRSRGLEDYVRLLATVTTVISAGLLVVACATAALGKDSFQLKGEVYPNSLFKIEMDNKAGKKLKSVRAGTYRIKVEDKATIHNFRLKGPGFNKATSVRKRTEAIWVVKLRKGTYTFLCDPHASTMRGKFRVT
jgi:hypothetical protein